MAIMKESNIPEGGAGSSSASYGRRLLMALFLIVLLGAVSSQGFLETSLYVKSNKLLKYGIYYLWLVLVALAGWWGWRRHPQQWVGKAWTILYLFALAALFLLGLIDLLLYPFPSYIRKDISHFRSFFLSPVLFAILYLLARLSRGGESKQ